MTLRFISVAAALGVIALAPALSVQGEDLQVGLRNGQVLLSTSGVKFLQGRALEKLRSGWTVPFDVQVSVLTDNKATVLRREYERFVFSYDLWQETFSISRMRSSSASVSHLSAHAAEQWCLQRLPVPVSGLPEKKSLWFRIDVHARLDRNRTSVDDNTPPSLGALVDLFSRTTRPEREARWRIESSAVRLADLGGSARP